MASGFEIVDEEYIEELKDKSGERTFSENERMKGTFKQIKKSTRTMPTTNVCRSFKHSEIQLFCLLCY